MSNDTSKDFSREAAHHLRTVARERGLEIQSSTAHELIAGYFGFHSRAAMVATEAVEFPVMFPSPEGPKTFTQVVPKEGTPSLVSIPLEFCIFLIEFCTFGARKDRVTI